MNKTLLFAMVFAMCVCGCRNGSKPAIETDMELENKVAKKLAEMTLEEKVGQMTQLNITAVCDKGKLTKEGEELIRRYKVGSFINAPDGMAEDPHVYNSMIMAINAVSIDAMGIPAIYGLDHVHGTTYINGGILFPQELNIAATFDRAHAYNMGEVTAYESRAASVPWTFSPTMDLGRNSAWPRLWESFGEDVYVNAEMGKAEVLGLQGNDPNHLDKYHIAACGKHYMGYGAPVSGQDRTPSSISRSQLREKFFEPFKQTLKAGVLTLMVNSASDNGMPFHCNTELLTDWVKKDLNWDGVIVTDWADIYNLYTRDKVASSKKEAVKLAINAGIDMAMVPYETQFCTDLIDLVHEGEVPMSRIDDAVRRVLRLKYRLGLFDAPDSSFEDYPEFGSAAHIKKAYRAAVESEVLLKNDGVLPLSKSARILLTGPNAHSMRTLNGGWSYTWQGNAASREKFTGKYNTILEAMRSKFRNVDYVPGVEYASSEWDDWKEEKVSDINAVVNAAKMADVIVCCVGENSYCETPGNINDLNLSENQKTLVRRLARTGKPIVLVLNEGRPRIINDIEPLTSAVVDVMLPGNFGGDALAALLSGEENFSGRLPFTYPKYVNKPATYDYKPCEQVGTMEGVYNYNATMDVQWPFGHGLSYTSFAYTDMNVSVAGRTVKGTDGTVAEGDMLQFKAGDEIIVTVNVTNTGSVRGRESVLLYSSDLYASSTPDVRRLRGFDKVSLAPGETKTLTIRLSANALAFVNYNEQWTLEKGNFILSVGELHAHLHCCETKVWAEKNIEE